MKATFQIPDELYREVKARSAIEGSTVREVAIGLFRRWLREKETRSAPHAPTVDWRNHRPPLAGLVPDEVTDHSMEAIRESIAKGWNEPL